MAYLITDLGMDRPTAMLMYRAERLQEKGQLRQALRYFGRVLEAKPDCEEARVNARMINQELAEQSQQRLPTVREQAPSSGTGPPASQTADLQTADLQFTFETCDCEKYESYWDEGRLNDAALMKARRILEDHGVSTPFVTLVSNAVESYTPHVYDDPWMNTQYTCRAVARVTFPPQHGAVASPANRSSAAAAPSQPLGLAARLGAGAQGTSDSQRSEPAHSQPEPNPEPSSGSGIQGSMLDRLRASQSLIERPSPSGQSCAAAAAAAVAPDDAESSASSGAVSG